jgi:hypothetical protein
MINNGVIKILKDMRQGDRLESFKCQVTLTRPADVNAYAAADAITNSTSAPTTLSVTVDATEACNVMITGARLISSSATGLRAYLYILPATFTATNDNAAFGLSDAEAKTAEVLELSTNFKTANNSISVSAPTNLLVHSTDGKLYLALQAYEAYTPVSEEQITIEVSGAILTT